MQVKSIEVSLGFNITDPEQAKQFREDKEAFERHARNMGKMQAYLDDLKNAEETGSDDR